MSAVLTGEAIRHNLRRQRHLVLYRAGISLEQIAKATGFAIRQIEQDVGEGALTLRKEFDEILSLNRRDALAGMWLTMDGVKFEAWQAWVRSQMGTEKRRTKRTIDGDGNESTEEIVETVTSAGDPRFLSLVSDTVWRQAQLAGFVSDGQAGRGAVGSDEPEVSEEDTVAIVEVGTREEAAAVAGKRFCRIAPPDESPGVVEGQAVPVSDGAEVP